MNQIKIGKFIAECRKNNSLTQKQLAEKLNITDRAISKWENGKAMPDSSIMLDLCNELKITVNELLSGERIEMNNYNQKAEENFIKLKQSEERIEKKMQIIQTTFTTLCVIFSVITIGVFIANMVMNYLYPESYDGQIFEWLQPLTIILTFTFIFTSGILSFREKYEIRERK